MTMQVVPSSELPLDPTNPYTKGPKRGWNLRRIVRLALPLLAVLAVIGPFTWWLNSAYANVLQPGGSSYRGGAAILNAGFTTEYCYRGVPGSTFVFGFSIVNAGSHDVTVQSIDQVWASVDQSVTIDPGSADTHLGLAGPDVATQHLPLTIHPGQERQLYLNMHLAPDLSLVDSQDLLDRVVAHVRSLGIDRSVDLHFGSDFQPLWLGISGPDDNGNYCDFDTPASGGQ